MISGKVVSHLWYHDLVYLHFPTFFFFPLAEEWGAQQACQEKELEWDQGCSRVGYGLGMCGGGSGLGMCGGESGLLMEQEGGETSSREKGAGVGE